jgi:hypothetical protein
MTLTSINGSDARAVLLALVLSGARLTMAASAQPDLMDSPGCKAATSHFNALFASVRDSVQASTPELADARRQAAIACFGQAAVAPGKASAPAGGGSVGTRSAYPPQTVPQAAGLPRPLPSTAAVTGVPQLAPQLPPQAPVQIDRPNFITSCDPSGCWSTDGTRLNRIGPELAGPRGICGVQAGVASCP